MSNLTEYEVREIIREEGAKNSPGCITILAFLFWLATLVAQQCYCNYRLTEIEKAIDAPAPKMLDYIIHNSKYEP